eukprot:8703879-Pyramimonas_sp.AAC.2
MAVVWRPSLRGHPSLGVSGRVHLSCEATREPPRIVSHRSRPHTPQPRIKPRLLQRKGEVGQLFPASSSRKTGVRTRANAAISASYVTESARALGGNMMEAFSSLGTTPLVSPSDTWSIWCVMVCDADEVC